MTPDRGEQGFTLIEVLVSLALLGMMAALLLQGLATAAIVAQRERGRAGGQDEVISAQRVLRAQIERLRPVTQLNSAIPIVEMRGARDMLSFVGPPQDRAAPDALQRFKLMRAANGDVILYAISTRAARFDVSGRNLTGWAPNTVLRGVRDIRFAYLGPAGPGRSRGWQDVWSDRSSPPDLIRIQMAFGSGDRRRWPDLYIRPRATRYGVCRLDAFTGKCGEER